MLLVNLNNCILKKNNYFYILWNLAILQFPLDNNKKIKCFHFYQHSNFMWFYDHTTMYAAFYLSNIITHTYYH